jgi:oligopeptide/dipeptide ABC transporter ATP-binding protein
MLNISNLTVEYISKKKKFYILSGVDLSLNDGEIIGIAGESGSGKTILAKTILGLVKPPIYKTEGTIILNDLTVNSSRSFKKIRGKKISIIMQNPVASLNPVMKIGEQLIETIMFHNKNISLNEAKMQSLKLLAEVEIDYPVERLKSYPFNLSGGMNQRVMIALSLASNPSILIADEPTTALDVTIQAQILNLLKKLNTDRKLSILFISHDISLLSKICQKIIILYSSEIMEYISVPFDLKDIKHPYTYSLLQCIPTVDSFKKSLFPIPGSIQLNDQSKQHCCIFYNRCFKRLEICEKKKPELKGYTYRCLNPL